MLFCLLPQLSIKYVHFFFSICYGFFVCGGQKHWASCFSTVYFPWYAVGSILFCLVHLWYSIAHVSWTRGITLFFLWLSYAWRASKINFCSGTYRWSKIKNEQAWQNWGMKKRTTLSCGKWNGTFVVFFLLQISKKMKFAEGLQKQEKIHNLIFIKSKVGKEELNIFLFLDSSFKTH